MNRLEVRCREWQGAKNKFGHGQRRINGRLEYVHRWVWQSVHGPLKKGECVLHKCDNPSCYLLEHLFVGTKTDNNRDRDNKGRGGAAYGSTNGRAKITEDDVREIRRRYKEGEFQRVIGDDYGLAQTVVSAIVRGKTWAQVQ